MKPLGIADGQHLPGDVLKYHGGFLVRGRYEARSWRSGNFAPTSPLSQIKIPAGSPW